MDLTVGENIVRDVKYVTKQNQPGVNSIVRKNYVIVADIRRSTHGYWKWWRRGLMKLGEE